MKRILVSSLGALIIGLSAARVAVAADHSLPGLPGLANCHGQTAAWFGQIAKTYGLENALRGLGQIAHAADVKVSEVQNTISLYCAGGEGGA